MRKIVSPKMRPGKSSFAQRSPSPIRSPAKRSRTPVKQGQYHSNLKRPVIKKPIIKQKAKSGCSSPKPAGRVSPHNKIDDLLIKPLPLSPIHDKAAVKNHNKQNQPEFEDDEEEGFGMKKDFMVAQRLDTKTRAEIAESLKLYLGDLDDDEDNEEDLNMQIRLSARCNDDFDGVDDDEHNKLPPMPGLGTNGFHQAFMDRIKICNDLQCGKDPEEQKEKTAIKIAALTQLLSLIADDSGIIHKLSKDEIQEYIQMVKNNIIRPIKPPEANVLFYEVMPSLYDPLWHVLDVVYLTLYRIHFCLPNNPNFNYDFIKALYPLLGAPDSNERVEVTHFIKSYANKHEQIIGTIINDLSKIFLMHLEMQDRPFHVSSALNILATIYEFAHDHDKYDQIIEKSVVPLIKDKFAFYFNNYLLDVLNIFVDNNPLNTKNVILEMLKFWPKTNVHKQASYTNFIAENLYRMKDADIKNLIKPIFNLFAEEVMSSNPKIADTSLGIWIVPELDAIIDEYNNDIMAIMIPPIMKTTSEHWSDSVRNSGMITMSTIFSKNNIEYLKEMAVKSIQKKEEDIKNICDGWSTIALQAHKNDSSINTEKQLAIIDKEFYDVNLKETLKGNKA